MYEIVNVKLIFLNYNKLIQHINTKSCISTIFSYSLCILAGEMFTTGKLFHDKTLKIILIEKKVQI